MNRVIDCVEDRLAGVFVRMFEGVDLLTAPHATFGTVRDWDSIAHLSLIVETEEEFGVEIGFEVADDIDCFEDLYRLVVARLEGPFPRFTAPPYFLHS